jgi:1-acyl-sn-glycerol-3-phosphate acyltransferase
MEAELIASGDFPSRGLIVSNHLSYLDILVLSATTPCAFISKSEIERWPIFGRFARWAGSVFVRRQKKGDAARMNASVVETLQSGVPVVLFPEGKTTDGHQVLRFHSTMVQPAIVAACLITPCAIAYGLEDGSVAQDVCYWGDMTLLPHVINLLGKRMIRINIAFGKPVEATADRKMLGHTLREDVARMYEQLRSGQNRATLKEGVPDTVAR